MALLTKATNCGFNGFDLQRCTVISGLLAGEDLEKLDPAYIKSDGKVYQAVTTASSIDGKSAYDGFVFADTKSGEPVDLVRDAIATFSSGLTPGALYYISASAAYLSDVVVTASDAPVAKAITATEILVY